MANQTITDTNTAGAARTRRLTKKQVVRIHEGDWRRGFDAGAGGKPASPVPRGIDGLSWIGGWIEGDAKRQGGLK